VWITPLHVKNIGIDTNNTPAHSKMSSREPHTVVKKSLNVFVLDMRVSSYMTLYTSLILLGMSNCIFGVKSLLS